MRSAAFSLLLAVAPTTSAFQLPARSPGWTRSVAASAIRMQWVEQQYSKGMRWIDDDEDGEVDVSQAAARAKLKAGPAPSLEPSEIVDMMLQAFKRGTDEAIADLFQYVLPVGELAMQFDYGKAGPMTNFRIKVRTEPRWKSIASRPHAALLHMRGYEVMGGVMTDPDIRYYMVRGQPFFPDCPEAESDVLFQFELVKMRGSMHAEMATPYDGCWMVNRVEPKYEDWVVRDPLSAERCPDVFKLPPRM